MRFYGTDTENESEEITMRRLLLTSIMAALAMVVFPLSTLSAGQENPNNHKARATSQDPFAGGPAVFFPQTSYTFDSILEGAKIEHEFVVENRGKTPLRIGRVRPD